MKTVNPIKLTAHRFSLLLLFTVLSACDSGTPVNNSQTAAVAPPDPSDDSFVILALGDSLTEGLGVKKDGNYPALLQASLHQQGHSQIKVVNSGLSGETSSGLKSRLAWVLQLKPDLTILNIGANDAMRGLPLELTRNNISDIISTIQASGSKVVLAGMQIYDNLGQEYVAGFKDMYPQLAAEHELPMIPFFLEHVAGDPTYNQADMIHPTSAGYAIIVERNVLPVVLPVLADILNN